MAQDLSTSRTAIADPGGSLRVVSIAAGATMLWRAIGAPSLGPILLGLGGFALLCHGLSGAKPAQNARQGARNGVARRDAVHVASDDSFPASDPPSWTPTSGPGRRH